MNKIIGSYYHLLYDLENHYFLEVKMRTWLNWAFFLLVLIALLVRFSTGVVLAVLALFLIFFISLSIRWAKRRYYCHFVPDPRPLPSPDSMMPLWPEDKLLHHVSGHFQVEGKAGDWTHLIAYYRTFETREHAIMARQTPSSFLKYGRCDPDTLGMWYIFIMPEDLLAVTRGRVYFGGMAQPGLRLHYRCFNEKGKAATSLAFLQFDSEADLERVQADLLLDMGGPACIPWRRDRINDCQSSAIGVDQK